MRFEKVLKSPVHNFEPLQTKKIGLRIILKKNKVVADGNKTFAGLSKRSENIHDNNSNFKIRNTKLYRRDNLLA